MSTVHRKTAKGVAEIDTRAHRLAPRLRSALILVDGRKTDDELSGLILVDPAATLASLAAEGFIELVAPATAAPPERRPGVTRTNGAAIASLQRDAVRELNHQIGPIAETLALKIERAKAHAELQPLLVHAVEMLRNLRGSASADAFAARFLGEP